MNARQNKHSGRIEVNGGRKAIAEAQNVYRRVWASACGHDGVDPASKFVVFSEDNPFVQFVNAAIAEVNYRKMEYAAGGYVGLRLA